MAAISHSIVRALQSAVEDQQTALEAWYPFLADHTMRTEFVPIRVSHFKAISRLGEDADLYEIEKLERILQGHDVFNVDEEELEESDERMSISDSIAVVRDTVIPALSEAVRHIGGVAFVKNSIRSAKDCIYDTYHASVDTEWRRRLMQWDEVEEGQERPNSIVRSDMLNPSIMRLLPSLRSQYAVNSWVEAAATAFRTNDGDVPRLMAQMLQSSRVHFDLSRAEHYYMRNARAVCDRRNDSEHDPIISYFAVRAWRTINPEDEFRVFVHQGRVTAISQYFHRCFYPRLGLPGAKEQLRARVLEFFALVIAPHISLDDIEAHDAHRRRLPRNFILDLVVSRYPPTIIIELNPWTPSTSACMFDWVNDRDILHGDTENNTSGNGANASDKGANVIVRVCESPNENVLYYMVPAWKRIAQEWVLGIDGKLCHVGD